MKSDGPNYGFIRKGDALYPAMEIDLASLDGVAQGQMVKVTVSHFRNTDRLRAWWALQYDCIKACGLDDWTLEAMGQHVRLNTGHFDEYALPDGQYFRKAKSVALMSKEMSEADMAQLFRDTEKLLAETFGYVKERRDGKVSKDE